MFLKTCSAVFASGAVWANDAAAASAAVIRILVVVMGPHLIEIYVALGRGLVRIFLGDFQHLIELLTEHVVMTLVLLHRFLEQILTAAGLAFHASHGGFEIGERGRLFVFLVANHGAGFGVDVKFALAAGAGDD